MTFFYKQDIIKQDIIILIRWSLIEIYIRIKKAIIREIERMKIGRNSTNWKIVMTKLKKGDFIKVGNDIGVIVFLERENDTPKEHIGVWYGELNNEGNPKYRTVPTEYCKKLDSIESYH